MAASIDLLQATAALVDISSESHNEGPITDHLEERLRRVPWLEITRIDNNLVARTSLGRSQRIILAGHTDTVPVNGNGSARVDGDTLYGLGSADMKSGLAVFLALAETLAEPTVDVTYVFYECEEVAAIHNGLKKLLAQAPDLVSGDAAILGEPTNAIIEAGCQGTMRAVLSVGGARAHTARPWMGRNAIHRLAPVIDRIGAWEPRRPVLDGCEYREAMQVVKIDGGAGNNVVPDRAQITINHRFAPDHSIADATEVMRSVIGAEVLADDATFEVVDASPAAMPGLSHPLLGQLSSLVGDAPRAKLGWTDVAFFAAQGIPALNFGPGDPTIAHTAGEFVLRSEIERAHQVLTALLTAPR